MSSLENYVLYRPGSEIVVNGTVVNACINSDSKTTYTLDICGTHVLCGASDIRPYCTALDYYSDEDLIAELKKRTGFDSLQGFHHRQQL